jgi:hypothetical protein
MDPNRDLAISFRSKTVSNLFKIYLGSTNSACQLVDSTLISRSPFEVCSASLIVVSRNISSWPLRCSAAIWAIAASKNNCVLEKHQNRNRQTQAAGVLIASAMCELGRLLAAIMGFGLLPQLLWSAVSPSGGAW